MSDRIAHEPVERPIRSVLAELGLTAAVAYLVGLCLAIAAANDAAPAVQVILVVVGIGLVFGYGTWLLGGSGVLLAALSLPLLILAADALLVTSGFIDLGSAAGLLGPGLSGILPPLLAVAAAATGLVSGLVLPGPRRLRGSHGAQPRSRTPVNTSAELSHGAVMERLRTSPSAQPGPTSDAEGVWFDDSTEEDGLSPVHTDAPAQETAAAAPTAMAPAPDDAAPGTTEETHR